MSAENVAWVYRHSPYKGTKFAIHLAMADIANSAHGNEIWMKHHKLAVKARTTRTTVSKFCAEMIADGHLELVEDNSQNGCNDPSRYRLLCHDDAALVFDSRTRSGLPGDPEPEVSGPANSFRKSVSQRQREQMEQADAPTLLDGLDSDESDESADDGPLATVYPMNPPGDSRRADADKPQTSAEAMALLSDLPLPADDAKAIKEAAGHVLEYYVLWRTENGLGRLKIGRWHGEIRKMAQHLIATESLPPQAVAQIVMEWHDKNMEFTSSGGAAAAPGMIKTIAQAWMDRGNGMAVHGVNGSGVTRRQHDTNARQAPITDRAHLANLI